MSLLWNNPLYWFDTILCCAWDQLWIVNDNMYGLRLLVIQEMLYWFTLLSIKATTESAKLSQKKESWSRLMAGLRCFQRLVVSGGPSYRLAPSIGERLFPTVTSFHVAELQVSRFWQPSLKEWRILTISLDSCHEDWIRDIDITWKPTLLQHHELEMYWEQLESNIYHGIHYLFLLIQYCLLAVSGQS